MNISKEKVTDFFKNLQKNICNSLEKADEKGKFAKETWQRDEGGGGITRVIKDGNVIEKGGVNFSEVYGKTPEVLKQKSEYTGDDFYATGVSIVIHPKNPKVPIIHMNVRYFEMSDGNAWFGGGIDLTPHYVDTEDAVFFHQSLEKVCSQFHKSYYPKFKTWADDYFYIPHRKETRGVGGIFFDYLKADEFFTLTQRFDFVKSVGESFAPIYTKFIKKNKNLAFTEAEKRWQLLRRGRYVEFNLVYDRGTKFGLQTAGRIESILMSLPLYASWEYSPKISPESPEGKTLSLLKKDIDWINY